MNDLAIGLVVIGIMGGAVGLMYYYGLFDAKRAGSGSVPGADMGASGPSAREVADMFGIPGLRTGVSEPDLFGNPIASPVPEIDLGGVFGVGIPAPGFAPSTGQPVAAGQSARDRAWGLSDADVLAKTLWGEARGEGLAGMQAVAAVIVNRVKSRRYPNTVKGVCLQPWQFSMWNPDDHNGEAAMKMRRGDSTVYDRCLDVAADAIAGRVADPTGGALHYAVTGLNPYWAKDATVSAQIGRHTFYTGVA